MTDEANAPRAPKRAGIYVRVSTATKSRQGDTVGYDQNPDVQEQPLRYLTAQRGWILHKVYSDRASDSTERRRGLDALMADARRGAFEVVVVFRFDRFARQRETVGPGSGGVPVAGDRLHFLSGGAGHVDANGGGDVRHHRGHGTA